MSTFVAPCSPDHPPSQAVPLGTFTNSIPIRFLKVAGSGSFGFATPGIAWIPPIFLFTIIGATPGDRNLLASITLVLGFRGIAVCALLRSEFLPSGALAFVEGEGTTAGGGDAGGGETTAAGLVSLLLLRKNKPAAITENISRTPAATPAIGNLFCFGSVFSRATDGVILAVSTLWAAVTGTPAWSSPWH